MNYLAIKNGNNKGVYEYETKAERKTLMEKTTGASFRIFEGEKNRVNALTWAGVKEVANRSQQVVEKMSEKQKKTKQTKESMFEKLLKKSKEWNAPFVKITMSNGDYFFMALQSFCAFETSGYLQSVSRCASCNYNDNEYKISINGSYYYKDRDYHYGNIQEQFHAYYKKEIIEYYANQNNYNKYEYMIPKEIELFKKMLETSKIKEQFIYQIENATTFEIIDDFVFVKDAIDNFNVFNKQEYSRRECRKLTIDYSSSCINTKEIVKIEPYFASSAKSMIIIDENYVKALKEFKETLLN